MNISIYKNKHTKVYIHVCIYIYMYDMYLRVCVYVYLCACVGVFHPTQPMCISASADKTVRTLHPSPYTLHYTV